LPWPEIAVAQGHSDGAGMNRRGIRRNSLRHRSILASVAASGKPGAVHKLLKIAALVHVSAPRIKLAMPSAFPSQAGHRAAPAALASGRQLIREPLRK
jgi:hypothetical protein